MTTEEMNTILLVLIVFMVITGIWLATLSYLVLTRKKKEKAAESEEKDISEDEAQEEEATEAEKEVIEEGKSKE